MTQHSLQFPAHGRAFWPACLAFVLIGAFTMPLAGCGDAADPTAPALPAGESDGYLAQIDPFDGLSGDAQISVTAPGHGRWLLGSDSETVIVNAMPDEPVQFFWRAPDGTGIDNTVTFRYGWNVDDPDDPQDPGWYGPPTTGYKARQTQPRTVWEGADRLIIERWDGPRLLVRVTIEVWGQPIMPRDLH